MHVHHHLDECLYDTPTFRKQIQEHDESVSEFGESLKLLAKVTQPQVKHSVDYINRRLELKSEAESFAARQDNLVATALKKFGDSIGRVEEGRKIFNQQINEFFIQPLDEFEGEVEEIKALRKQFENASEHAEDALRNYMKKKPNDPMIHEATKELSDKRQSFQGDYKKYVAKLNDVEAKKNIDFVEDLLRYMYAESAFHHRCYEIFQDLEPYMKGLEDTIRHSRMQPEKEAKASFSPTSKPTASPRKAGYLYERKEARLLTTGWSRKYYRIEGNELICTARDQKGAPPQIYNLCICNVKASDEYERRFCFILTSPTGKLGLQAENEQDMEEWIRSIEKVREIAFNSGNAMTPPGLRRGMSDTTPTLPTINDNNHDWLDELWKIPGNDSCADCGKSEPEWASTNLGILICIECSGIHRKLGVHLSKVRSAQLDKWEPEVKEVMRGLGNAKVNAIYEESIPDTDKYSRITPTSERDEREEWITRKYFDRSFVAHQEEDDLIISNAFWNAITESNLSEALRYLAQDADVNHRNQDHQSKTALHQAVEDQNDCGVEFLLQWSSDVNVQDGKGWTSLHYAANTGNAHLLLILLKRDASTDIKNEENKTPLELAVEKQNVQAVTLLRLFAFDKQHNSSPANSLDLGFGEAMSSFKHSPNRTIGQDRLVSKSVEDLSRIPPVDDI